MIANTRVQVTALALAFGLFALIPFLTHAQTSTQDDLSATIRAELLSDPRTSTLSQQQLDAMVQLLTQEAQKQGITSNDIYWRPHPATPEGSGGALSALEQCDTLSCVADWAYGFVGPDSFIAFLLGISSMGLIWVIAEMLHRQKYPHVTAPPAAGPSSS